MSWGAGEGEEDAAGCRSSRPSPCAISAHDRETAAYDRENVAFAA